jgi:hypothetical protein
MRNWIKRLSASLVVLFTCGVASTAYAFPPQCTDVCSCQSACTDPCFVGTFLTTCDYEVCACAVDDPALTADGAALRDTALDVCTADVVPSSSSEAPAGSDPS